MGVAWRTDARQATARLQLVIADDGPDVGHGAVEQAGTSSALVTENGAATFHQVRLDGLRPDTPYAYRVRGSAGWSEWFPFRTATATFRPFRILYFGDMQSDILEVGSRVVRHAFRTTPDPAFVLHGGDLVQQRDGGVHDDEWGEWHAAGGWAYASVPQAPAAGNHEYLERADAGGTRRDVLGPHWPRSFALPRNGATTVRPTTYTFVHQEVRVVALDGTAARDRASLADQRRWLDKVLRKSAARWTLVVIHQPFFPCARARAPDSLDRVLRPVIEAHKVDLVLQGHDHCYSRVTSPTGDRGASWPRAAPAFVSSVAGGKMYALNARAPVQTDRTAEDTQLYQTISFEEDRLEFRAFTATGRLYDGFDILGPRGRRTIRAVAGLPKERRCVGSRGPAGGRCTARAH